MGPDGRMQSLTLLRGTGDTEVDRWVYDTLLRRSFNPGLVDGVAVAMDHTQHVRIRARP